MFNGLPGDNADHWGLIMDHVGIPDYIINCECDKDAVKQRYMAKNEIEEWGEDQDAALAEIPDHFTATKEFLAEKFKSSSADRVRQIDLKTNQSLESTFTDLANSFSAQVIVVSHDKRLATDTICSNLAIKFNLLYISVYQVIKREIESESCLGKKLLSTKKPKEISYNAQAKDEFKENEFSAAHFDLNLVIEVVKNEISRSKTTQKFILLEGLCNSQKLQQEDDKLELRPMDELVQIEKRVGTIAGVASLQFNYEKENIEEDDVQW